MEAVGAYRAAANLDLNMSGARFSLGFAEYWKNGGKPCEASFEPYSRCIALDPKHAMAHRNLGVVLQHVRKDYDGAEAMYRKAIELDPKHAKAHCNLGIVLDEVRNLGLRRRRDDIPQGD